MKKNSGEKIKKNICSYVLTNRLFITYLLISVIASVLFKYFTVAEVFSIRNFVPEFALILILGSFCYLIKPKNQYNYLFGLIVFFTVLYTVNSVYYQFYASFASFGELATLKQVETVTGSVWEKLRFVDLIYLFMPIIFRQIHIKLKSTSYYEYISKIEKGSQMFIRTILVGVVLLGVRFIFATSADYSSIQKQWNRASVVKRFGIIIYQGNDLIQTLTPKFGSLFGYEDAVEVFKNFYSKYTKDYSEKNRYSNVLEGMNVVFVHMEGQQTLLMDQKFNGVELTPNLNRLAKNGTFFSKFYPQISTGTSSDSEFTLLSSLMPAASGTIFVSYYDRNYITTPKILADKGYYTFSMHGNASTMWNRNKAHKSLGYQDLYFKESYTYKDEDVINLGVNDKVFFKQAISIMEEIETNNTNYMGSVITLSNHSPFTFLDKYGEFDLTNTYDVVDPETSETIKVESNYLEGTSVGNYFHSAHYADEALGEFINYIEESDKFNNTVFVFYGDHDVKLGKNQINLLYNYDVLNDRTYDENDSGYTEFDSFDYELSKNTPLIIWTKNKSVQNKLPKVVDSVMGMYDVMPTLGNLMGFSNKYALGNDIFSIGNDNIVIFPNGNFLTNYIYYNNLTGEYKILKDGVVLDQDYINNNLDYVDDVLEVSNAIVVYDLLDEKHLSQIEGNLIDEEN